MGSTLPSCWRLIDMAPAIGAVLGAGLCLVWFAFLPSSENTSARQSVWMQKRRDDLIMAGFPSVSVSGLIIACVSVGVVSAGLALAIFGSGAIAVCLGGLAGRAPLSMVSSRSTRRRARLRNVWPDAVDNLVSGIRAGLSLPEALQQLAQRGPVEIRPAFAAFGSDFRTTGDFPSSLNALKERLADPIADRIIEAIRVARDVGGTDLGRVLRALASFLRDDVATRGELEARQSWTVNGARLAVAAPWVVLLVLATRPEGSEAYSTSAGTAVVLVGAACTVVAYRLMVRVGRLPVEERVLR